MTKRWMPAPDEDTCKLVSHVIYRLSRPAEAKVSDTTTYLFGWRQAANGSWWMDFDLSHSLPISAERSTETADALTMFVQAGQLSAESAANIQAIVQANVGNTITLGDVVPPEWLAQMLTDEEAAALWSQDDQP